MTDQRGERRHMSPYLAKPLHTEAQARADLARRRHLVTLREMAADFAHLARGAESSEKHRNAGYYRDRQHACDFALRELIPMTEGPRQTLDAMAGAE